ncbi:M28 family peptidase [Paludisphaera rhizosphaerae]|uniref:M28 family peptidase n=1 Tax=Paludisphaera rhizosphaerae TaxID=2711216 RepID=UPI0013EB1E5E|nr:M28 family peptidase [Paludisphaera rhizosphaerae]
MRIRLRLVVPTLAVCCCLPTAHGDEPPPPLREMIGRISPDSLRGHVSFLASDALEGRGTPSKGLDVAAEYIASQFRRAGLEPLGDDGFFQTADWEYFSPDSAYVEIKVGDRTLKFDATSLSGQPTKAVDLSAAPVIKVDANNAAALAALTAEAVAGKVVMTEVPTPFRVPREKAAAANQARMSFLRRLDELKPALVLDVDRDSGTARGLRRDAPQGARPSRPMIGPMVVAVHSPELAEILAATPVGPTDAKATIAIGEPKARKAKVRNVVGLLRGSDPALKETYVMVSAHYDHLGIGPKDGQADGIYNGANDDASGTASVIEIASALATMQPKPKRSVVFATFYGEEHGLIGSTYYAAHPVVPLASTAAAVNLEQLGRTDDTEGPRVDAANVTGFDFSTVTDALRKAGESVGVALQKHPQNSDLYFNASDNAALARAGVPAHTVSVAYAFPDYHGRDDEWDRIDYVNMSKIDRMVALGVVVLANDENPPKWDAANPKTEPYRKAREGK